MCSLDDLKINGTNIASAEQLVDGALLIIEVFLGIREGERDPENIFGGYT